MMASDTKSCSLKQKLISSTQSCSHMQTHQEAMQTLRCAEAALTDMHMRKSWQRALHAKDAQSCFKATCRSQMLTQTLMLLLQCLKYLSKLLATELLM